MAAEEAKAPSGLDLMMDDGGDVVLEVVEDEAAIFADGFIFTPLYEWFSSFLVAGT